MTLRDDVTKIVFSAIDEFNEQNDLEVARSLDEVLFGAGGQLDSMGLVNLVVLIEQETSEQLDVDVTIADEKALARKQSPFRTVETLIEYVVEKLADEGHE